MPESFGTNDRKRYIFWIKIAGCEKEYHQWKRQSTCPQYTYSVLFSSGLKRFGPIPCCKRLLGDFFFFPFRELLP